MNKSLISINLKRPLISNLIPYYQLPSTSRYQSTWDTTDSSENNNFNSSKPSSSSSSVSYDRTDRPKRVTTPKFKKQTPPSTNPLPSPKELEKRVAMRIQRAERLERKDLTAQLTESKTYMGGFTQPRHLAFLNTLDSTRKVKDSYEVRVGRDRVRPSSEAYEPHVVYLAVTRYPIKWPHGRATRRECFSGFCSESELKERFESLNYGRRRADFESKGNVIREEEENEIDDQSNESEWVCPKASKEYCDLAVWPESPEARSLANRKYYNLKKLIAKAEAAALKAVESGEPIEEFIPPILPECIPPVLDWTRPSPPYLDHRLIVPLLTITLPTRPLASTLARLCNSFPRGLPFYASVPNNDRKDGPAFFRRLLRMRANRIRELTKNIVEKLDGYGGGLFGLRMNSEDKGRGVEGEGLGEEVKRPQGGWAKVRWLTKDSEIWNGIERESYMDDWVGLDGISEGDSWDEKGLSIERKVKEPVESFDSDSSSSQFVPEPFIVEQKRVSM